MMKFVKQNLISLISVVVVILAVAAIFYPFKGWRSALHHKMRHRLGQVAVASSLGQTNVTLPGHKPLYKGVVTNKAIAVRQKVQQAMVAQMGRIARLAARLNSHGRVIMRGGKEVPLLNGRPESRLLPRPASSYQRLGNFRRQYRELFTENPRHPHLWLVELHAAVPPTPRQIRRLVKAQLRRMRMNTPKGFHGRQTISSKSLYQAIARRMILNTAASHKIYASPASFQIRSFVRKTRLPNATEIFNAFVDCWLQGDIVHAILEVNHGAQNIGDAPIKRLVHISVGADASSATPDSGSGNGPIFLRQASLSGNNSTGTNVSAGISMTGHVGTHQYDVTFVDVTVMIQPTDINKFIDAIYRQNDAYTVLNVNLRTVDPIDAITHGYAYGAVPVVRANILLEAILFRKWTVPIMPAAYRTALGITATKKVMP